MNDQNKARSTRKNSKTGRIKTERKSFINIMSYEILPNIYFIAQEESIINGAEEAGFILYY